MSSEDLRNILKGTGVKKAINDLKGGKAVLENFKKNRKHIDIPARKEYDKMLGVMKGDLNTMRGRVLKEGAKTVGTYGAVGAGVAAPGVYAASSNQEKVAFYMDTIEKAANEVTVKDLTRTYKEKNSTPTPKSIGGRLNQAENFYEGTNVRSKLYPNVEDGDLNYIINSNGIGRRSDRLTASSSMPDVAVNGKSESDISEYKSRIKPHTSRLEQVQNQVGASMGIGGGLGALALGAGARALTKNPTDAIIGGIGGAILGSAAGVGVNSLRERGAAKKLFASLNQDERKAVLSAALSKAHKQSQNANEADNMTGTSTTVVYV